MGDFGQMDQSNECGEVKHKLDQLLLEQVFFLIIQLARRADQRGISKNLSVTNDCLIFIFLSIF